MTHRNRNALVKRQTLPIQTNQDIEEIPVQSNQLALTRVTSLPPIVVAPAGWSTPRKVDAAERDIWFFFEQECSQGWHPDSQHGTAAIKSLADCLVDLAQARYANLNVVYFTAENNTAYPRKTIRETMESCRSLCTDTLLSIKGDMQKICDRSNTLWGLQGLIMNAIRACSAPSENATPLDQIRKDIEQTQSEIQCIFEFICQRWSTFHSEVQKLITVLDEQLALAHRGRDQVGREREAARAVFENNKQEIDRVANLIQNADSRLAQIRKNKIATKGAAENLVEEIKSLNSKLDRLELSFQEIDEDLKRKPIEFKEAERLEKDRQELARKKATQVGWGTWAQSFVWDTSGEAARVAEWKVTEQKHEKWYASAIRRRLELSDSIAQTKQKKKQAELKRGQMTGAAIQAELEKLETQQRTITGSLIGTKETLKDLDGNIERLTREFNTKDALLLSMNDYAEMVPGLCSSLRELAVHVDLSNRAYKQVLERYKYNSMQMQKLCNNMYTQQSPLDMNMLCDNVTRQRIVFLVIASASAWSSHLAKELYDEALRHIAPVGSVPESHTAIPGRSIRLNDARSGHMDLHQLALLAEKQRSSINEIQLNSVNSLRSHVQDIITSVQAVRPAKESRSWWSRKNKKSITESLPAHATNSYQTPRGGAGELP